MIYPYNQQAIDNLRKFGNVTPNGVVFDDELTSINGCTFYLMKEKGITNKMIAEAKRYLRSNRDVVKFHIACVEGTK